MSSTSGSASTTPSTSRSLLDSPPPTWSMPAPEASTSRFPSPRPSYLLHGSPYNSSRSSIGSPAIWFSPALGASASPTPGSDRKGKGKALEVDQPWRWGGHSASSSRSSTRSKRISVELEGGYVEDLTANSRELSGLGFDTIDEDSFFAPSTADNEQTPRARRPSHSTAKVTSWKPVNPLAATIPDTPLSRLTRRRVSPSTPLPLTAPLATRSFSDDSTASDHKTRLRHASRPGRERRRKGGVEATAAGLCTCIAALLLVVYLCTGSRRTDVGTPSSRWRLFEGGGLLPFALRPPRARSSEALAAAYTPAPGGWRRLTGRRKVTAPARDTLVLYRILGNDLPPRHTHGQTLRNVRFMLEQEHGFAQQLPAPFRRVEKYYVLNRIASSDTISSLYGLFDEFSVPVDHILHVPFDWEQYATKSLRWDGSVADFPSVWGLERPDYHPPSPFVAANANDTGLQYEVQQRNEAMGRLRAIDYTYHDKNQYAIHNNGGRNFALGHGRGLPHARWILPLDGNCFFTPAAMQSLAVSLASAGEPYVVIPMARLLDNAAVLPTNLELAPEDPLPAAPDAPEEPQIGFRYDAPDSYQSAMRYGRRSKLELLWRLGAVPRSRALDRRTLPWETHDRQILTAQSYGSIRSGFVTAGWVFRLFSGDSRQEQFSAEAGALRNMNRVKGIVAFLERLDEIIVRGRKCERASCGFSKDRLWLFDTDELAKLTSSYAQGYPEAISRVAPLVKAAHAACSALAVRLAKGTLAGADLAEASRNATMMALAGHLVRNSTLTLSAASLLHHRFFAHSPSTGTALSETMEGDGRGYIFPMPATTYDQPLWLSSPSPASPWSASLDPALLLDALRLLSHVHLPRALRRSVRDLLPTERTHAEASAQLAHLLFATSSSGLTLAEGARYDHAVANLAAYVNDARLLGRIASRASLRMRKEDKPVEMHARLAAGLRNVRYVVGAVEEMDGRKLSLATSLASLDFDHLLS